MNFVEDIFRRLSQTPDRSVLQEVRDGRIMPTTSGELLALIQAARAFLRRAGLKKGDRCALLAPNSVRWTAVDLAIMAEGIIVVPLYARQAPRELVGMMKDCSPALIICGDAALGEGVVQNWPEAPRACLLDEVFLAVARGEKESGAPAALADDDPITIIYTSGTSGEPKGVVLNVGNVGHMLSCTNARLDLLMGPRDVADRVFHYLPTCFAGSWILLLTCLTRNSILTLSTDLTKLADEMRVAAPNYFLNVPAVLERIRANIEEQIRKRGGAAQTLFEGGKAAWFRRQADEAGPLDSLRLALARALVFRAIRKKIGPNLKAIICGSAPLAKETQLFFMLLGLPVLQVYGLTETTAICTMDHPHHVTPGRVGPAIPGIEMRLGEADEILVRGPNVFPGYWNRPEATAQAFSNGWFRTGDQGDVDEAGNWAVTGRVKNLIILSSGHNIAPEPLEEVLGRALPAAKQVLVVGHGRSFLAAIITGDLTRGEVEKVLENVNPPLPHYQRIHAFHIHPEPFTIENGLLTANGKLKREVIAAWLRVKIEDLYRKASAEGTSVEAERAKREA
jgi:long-chain acyl-CoA synthetase